jgi:hypothetical protein
MAAMIGEGIASVKWDAIPDETGHYWEESIPMR